MEVSGNVWQFIVDRNAILVKELTQNRRIIICFIRSMVTKFNSHCYIKIFKSKTSFVSKAIAGINNRKIYRCIAYYLLKINICMPVEMLCKSDRFLHRDLQYIE